MSLNSTKGTHTRKEPGSKPKPGTLKSSFDPGSGKGDSDYWDYHPSNNKMENSLKDTATTTSVRHSEGETLNSENKRWDSEYDKLCHQLIQMGFDEQAVNRTLQHAQPCSITEAVTYLLENDSLGNDEKRTTVPYPHQLDKDFSITESPNQVEVLRKIIETTSTKGVEIFSKAGKWFNEAKDRLFSNPPVGEEPLSSTGMNSCKNWPPSSSDDELFEISSDSDDSNAFSKTYKTPTINSSSSSFDSSSGSFDKYRPSSSAYSTNLLDDNDGLLFEESVLKPSTFKKFEPSYSHGNVPKKVPTSNSKETMHPEKNNTLPDMNPLTNENLFSFDPLFTSSPQQRHTNIQEPSDMDIFSLVKDSCSDSNLTMVKIESKLADWKLKSGNNIRALLLSLDMNVWEAVLWPRLNMTDLMTPHQVKVAYMKTIAKVHPDKWQTSSTMDKFTANGIFCILNTAWEGFRLENKF